MNLCRAETKDGKEMVGWYFSAEDIQEAVQRHFIILPNAEIWRYIAPEHDTKDDRCSLDEAFFVEIDPATLEIIPKESE
jgi:hypothetical protein